MAHDLDVENTTLLRERKLSAVLHHDLRTDLRRACHAIMQAQGALPGPVRTNPVSGPGDHAAQRAAGGVLTSLIRTGRCSRKDSVQASAIQPASTASATVHGLCPEPAASSAKAAT